MSKVLLDNWGLSECLNSSSRYLEYYNPNNKLNNNLCWQNLLTSFILWDDIYFNFYDQTRSVDRIIIGDFFSLFSNEIKDNKFLHIVNRNSLPFWEPDVDKIKELYEKIKAQNLTINQQKLLLRGYNYVVDSNYLGCNYLPHPLRAEVLYNSDIFKKGFDRKIYFDILDDNIKHYIEEVNALCKNQLMVTYFPVLYKYIYENTSTKFEEMQMALSLRNNKDVIAFRKSINEIENELERGNISALKASLKKVQEICDDVTNEIYKKPLSFSVSLGLSPTIDLNLETKNRVKSKLHTTFLYDITRFSITGTVNEKPFK